MRIKCYVQVELNDMHSDMDDGKEVDLNEYLDDYEGEMDDLEGDGSDDDSVEGLAEAGDNDHDSGILLFSYAY